MGESNLIICGDCPLGKKERVVGDGITEPPYLNLIRCKFATEYYHDQNDECKYPKERAEMMKGDGI